MNSNCLFDVNFNKEPSFINQNSFWEYVEEEQTNEKYYKMRINPLRKYKF